MNDECDLSKMKSRKNPYASKLKQLEELTEPVTPSEPNGAAMARIMDEVAAKKVLSEIADPSEWQRDIRKGRSLPFRED